MDTFTDSSVADIDGRFVLRSSDFLGTAVRVSGLIWETKNATNSIGVTCPAKFLKGLKKVSRYLDLTVVGSSGRCVLSQALRVGSQCIFV